MRLVSFNVDKSYDERIDLFLARKLEDYSRAQIQKLIKDNNVNVNGQSVKPRYLVKKGDNIVVKLYEPKKIEIIPEDIPLDIIYEDDDIAIINKPKGMVVHPDLYNHSETLVNGLLYYMDSLSTIGGPIRPGIVHRIDKDTSGLLVVAKNDVAHKFLISELKVHNINRGYIALVHGDVVNDNATIRAPIGRDPKNRIKMAVTNRNSKLAITHYQVIERFGDYTLLNVTLETGRTHQIRVHMAFINHPVVGDPFYSNIKCNFNTKGQLLHANKLGLIHPRTKNYMEFECELPIYFKKIIIKLKRMGE